MEVRKIPGFLAGPPPVAEAILALPAPRKLSVSHPVMSAAAPPAMVPEEAATGHKKLKRKKAKEQAEVPAAPSPSPRPPAAPKPGIESPTPRAPETLSSAAAATLATRRKERRMKMPEENQSAASPLLEPVEEAGGKEEKKRRKRRIHGEVAASLFQSAVAIAGGPILEGEFKAADKGRRKRRRVKEQEQEQSAQSPLSGGEHAADAPKCECVTVRTSSNCSKKPRVLSNREILRMRIESRKQQPLPHGLLNAMAMAANSSPNSIEQNPNHSSPFGAFFDQFCYKPSSQQGRTSPPLPKTPDRPARPPPRGHTPSDPSQLTANGTSKSTKTTTLSAKRPRSASLPVSLSHEKVQPKDKERPEKKQGKPKPLLSTAEKRSDKYRRLPLDQLILPPRSPHKLLQEKYASDPWKVIVICMLLNLTHGKQVRKKVKGFFKRYPDPQTACRADPEKMAEYLAPLGLQHVKAKRIQRFSKDYVEKEWAYITELCGVGKYAADAYAIFCAGRATEVVPADHKLVDYWKYVCFELPLIQEPENAQEPGMTDQLEKVVPKVQELVICC